MLWRIFSVLPNFQTLIFSNPFDSGHKLEEERLLFLPSLVIGSKQP